MSFKLTYILLLGIILCPSLNHVTWGLGWLRMCGKFRTAACPSVTVFLWSVSMKSPMSAKKKEGKKRVLPFSPFLFRGQRNQCVSQKPLALIIAHGALDQRTVWSLVSRGRWTSGRKEIPVLLVHTGRASTSSPAWPLCSWANTEGFY